MDIEPVKSMRGSVITPVPVATGMDSTDLPDLPKVSPIPTTAPAEKQKTVVVSLAGLVRQKFERAKSARQSSGVDTRLMKAMRARALEYEPDRLRAIRQLYGADYTPPYAPLIDTKCRATADWLTDALITPDRIWALEPKPILECPDDVKAIIRQNIAPQVAMPMVLQMVASGKAPDGQLMPLDEMAVDSAVEEAVEKQCELMVVMLKKVREKLAEKETARIDDQFNEGGWIETLKSFINDLVTYPLAVMVGPLPRTRKKLAMEYNPISGKHEPQIKSVTVETWERVSPLDWYPAPDANKVNDGYMTYMRAFTRKQLYDLMDIDGFNKEAIKRVLGKFRYAGLHELTNISSERSVLENKGGESLSASVEKIDCIVFFGSVPGQQLIDYGINDEQHIITDPDREYDCYCYMIDNEIIMASLNPDPFGDKPIHVTSFMLDDDKMWSKSIPDLLEHLQVMINAVRRAASRNVGYASGPMVEVNTDRVPEAQSGNFSMYPERVIKSTGKEMEGNRNKAVNFYQPPFLALQLAKFEDHIMDLADFEAGIARINHGSDMGTTGAMGTASGMSMYITQSSRGIKGVIKNIDTVIKSCVSAQVNVNKLHYQSNLQGDIEVVPRGTSSLMAKEQRAIRLKEFMATSQGNPLTMQILGQDGWKEVLREQIKSLDMDVDRLIPDEVDAINKYTSMGMPGGSPPPPTGPGGGGPNLTPAGDRRNGADFNVFRPEMAAAA